jgi:cbb3-type cytochrome oxidase maturation protein
MEVILILMTLSLMLGISFLIAFLWAVKSDQYEDTHTPAMRILMEDDRLTINNKNNQI